MEKLTKENILCDVNRLVLGKQEKKGGKKKKKELDDLAAWLWLLDLICKVVER